MDNEAELLDIEYEWTTNEQQLFASSFYGFLNFDSKKDFVINFDDVWKWLGYTRKDHAKTVLKNILLMRLITRFEKQLPQLRELLLQMKKIVVVQE